MAVLLLGSSAQAQKLLLFAAEGNRLRRFDIESIDNPPLRQDILIERASLDPNGRDVNGPICVLPDGGGRFLMGEDTGQPETPPGWGVFDPDGTQVGKLTATYFLPQGEPFGCAFDSSGRLFTTEIGNTASGDFNGQLIMWLPPFDQFPGPPGAYPDTAEPSRNFCKIAVDIGTPGMVAVDEEGRVYVTAARAGRVLRYLPPFPDGPDEAGGCGGTDPLGSPMAENVSVELFIQDVNVQNPSGIARAPNGNWYVSSVLSGVIAEFDSQGAFVRRVLDPGPPRGLPVATGHPQALALDANGNIYYADLNLRLSPSGGIGPGPNGTVRRITFDSSGSPSAPVIIREGLAFPDGVGVMDGVLKPCPGDCDDDVSVSVAELVTGVNITLGEIAVSQCPPFDSNADQQVTVDELESAVHVALAGCGSVGSGAASE
jgi:hypothetical protein